MIFEDKIKLETIFICITVLLSPTKDDRVPKLVYASSRYTGPEGLSPAFRYRSQPYCYCPIPYCDPSRSRQDARYKPASSADLALPA
jgi:hypothetical protein